MSRPSPLGTLLALCCGTSVAAAQQQPDTSADVSVTNPAHVERHPRLAIDEAHNNFHTMDNRFSPFARLMADDGCEVLANTDPFTNESLARLDVLVIANAGGDADNQPMFSSSELDALERWVLGGCSVGDRCF